MSDLDLRYYPTDYADSRRRFIRKVKSLSTPHEAGSWHIPGARDEDLFVDHVYLPPLEKPATLFVITSGIHGLEGYAGAAIQAMFIDTILPGVDRRHTGIFIVHAMNPHGFKHHRRSTEAHVNLNRNFSLTEDLYELKNAESRVLNEKFIPKRPVDSLKSLLVQNMRTVDGKIFFGDVPEDHFTKSVSIGQFESPTHLEYGGAGPEPQAKHLIDWLRKTMPEYRDIVLLDLHTGLGHSGRLHLLTSGSSKELDETLFARLFDLEQDRDAYEFTPADDEGFYETYGSINGVFPDLATPKQRVVAITMEFGTIGHSQDDRLESTNRWLIEHQGIHYGYANAELEAQVCDAYLRKFFPSEEIWRKKVIVAARSLFTRVFERSNGLVK